VAALFDALFLAALLAPPAVLLLSVLAVIFGRAGHAAPQPLRHAA
jgi:hypothetical protein